MFLSNYLFFRNRKFFPVLIFAAFILVRNLATAQQPASFPVPSGNPNQLFYLQRTPNANTIVYELNYSSTGELDAGEPVHVYWIRYGDQGQRAELTYIQRHFAYGIKAKKISKDNFELHMVARKQHLLYLHRSTDNKFYVYTTINNRLMILRRLFLKINPGGSFWSPNVEYIEFKGVDPVSGQELTERLKIAS